MVAFLLSLLKDQDQILLFSFMMRLTPNMAVGQKFYFFEIIHQQLFFNLLIYRKPNTENYVCTANCILQLRKNLIWHSHFAFKNNAPLAVIFLFPVLALVAY